MFPTAVTHPAWPWKRLPALPAVVFAAVPAVGGARQLYMYSERTGQTYEKRCHGDDARVLAIVTTFARQSG
jgi:hypothetical protein